MADLNLIPNGALLIRNGVIEDVGSTRRVENLANARRAREIDATGKIVMPAFVDADVALVVPAPLNNENGRRTDTRDDGALLRLMSRKRVQVRAAAMASEWARYGCVTVGAHSASATDLQNISKVLRVHQTLQSKPLRIRSIFTPRMPPDGDQNPAAMLETLTSRWLPSVWSYKQAYIVEFTVGGPQPALDTGMIGVAATMATGLGFATRLRSAGRLDPATLQLALSAGTIAIVAPMDGCRAFADPLSAIGCVRVLPASEGFDDAVNAAPVIRTAINEGAAIALASSYRLREVSSFNMQFLLHLAVHRLGLTPEEAITATTWNPACSLRLSQVTGSLEFGKSADLLLMEVPDYRELPRRAGHHDVSLVMRAGHVIDSRLPGYPQKSMA
jgi:imidazolonepropionase